MSVAATACVAPPQRLPPEATTEIIPPPTQVFFYPTADQNADQQDRDRYECHLWAVKQTGYDLGLPQLAPHQRVVVEPMPPPGTDTAAGVVTGAAIGAIASGPHNSAEGAVIGAAAGAVIGSVSDSARTTQAQQVQRQYDRVDQQRHAQLERQAQDYRRAMSACLEGRGYKVR